MDSEVLERLAARQWPGNVRELKNVVERMAILSGDRVTVVDLPEDPHESPFEDESHDPGEPSTDDDGAPEPASKATYPEPGTYPTLREHREQSERKYIVDMLKITGWNISRTAVILGVERTNLHKKIRGYGIKRGEG
jgi:DNA-binding NtrC family response regulator